MSTIVISDDDSLFINIPDMNSTIEVLVEKMTPDSVRFLFSFEFEFIFHFSQTQSIRTLWLLLRYWKFLMIALSQR